MRFSVFFGRTVIAFAATFVSSALLAAGSKENNIETNNDDANNTLNDVTQNVGPSGSRVENVALGAAVDIPPGALAKNIDIKVGQLADPTLAPLPAGLVAHSPIISYQPHNQTFALDVNISIKHTGGERLDLRLLRAEPGTGWSEVAITERTASLVTRKSSTFSLCVVASPDGAPPG